MLIGWLARQLVVQTLEVVTCLLTTSSCTCGTANIGEKSLFLNASACFNDATQGLNPGKSRLGGIDVLVEQIPLQLSRQLLLKPERQASCGLFLPLSHSPLDLPELQVFGLQLFTKRGCCSSFSSSIA